MGCILKANVHGIALANKRPLLRGSVDRLVRLLLRTNLRIRVRAGNTISLSTFYRRQPMFAVSCGLPSDKYRRCVVARGVRLLKGSSAMGFMYNDRGSLLGTLSIVRACGLAGEYRICLDPIFKSVRPIRVMRFVLGRRLGNMELRVRVRGMV